MNGVECRMSVDEYRLLVTKVNPLVPNVDESSVFFQAKLARFQIGLNLRPHKPGASTLPLYYPATRVAYLRIFPASFRRTRVGGS